MKLFVWLSLAGLAYSAVAPKKDRVLDHTLSDKEPGSKDYDHDAFIGSEEAKAFDQLPPDESRRRLGVIAEKIDEDKNGKISEEELEKWIVFTQTRYVREDADKQFQSIDTNSDDLLEWNEYMQQTYGFLHDEDNEFRQHDSVNYTALVERDHRRWKVADVNGDGKCTLEEFRSFLHPEEFDHMRDVVAMETLDDIDKNKDGFVDVDEYLGDMYNKDGGEEEPDWLATEREHFSTFRDTNKDGKLDAKEIRMWIMPDDYNHPKAESKHLISVADDDKDGFLSKEEILEHYDSFVGSQATEWGEALNRHDEF